jgi:hypothetical protein
MWAAGLYPDALAPGDAGGGAREPETGSEEQAYRSAERERHRNDDPHLRSCNELVGYHLHATDGEIGHVAGLLLDDRTWAIRYLVVDTSNWWLGHKVLIAPPWINDVSWSARTVCVDLNRDAVKTAPPYVAGDEPGREREISLYEHYGRTWYGAGLGSLASQF